MPAQSILPGIRRAADRNFPDRIKKRTATTVQKENRNFCLYRYFGHDGVLLYVGISLNGIIRQSQHRDKPWYPLIESSSHSYTETLEEVKQVEKRTIIAERPLFNKTYRPRLTLQEVLLKDKLLDAVSVKR
jgi:hypothetical protein